MKKIYFLLVMFAGLQMSAQMTVTQTPTGTSLPGTAANSIHAWYRGGNTTAPTTNNIFGTFWNSEVHHYTNGIWRFSTTTNNGLNNGSFNATPTLVGDGISIRNNGSNSGSYASIDLFTASSNSTALRMGRAFLLQTANSRTEQIGNYNGFWYNTTNVYPGFTPMYVWNMNQIEYGRLSSGAGIAGRWRFGPNPTNLNANNRVEIFSAAGDPYFPNASGLRLTNLTSAGAIVPNGTNGVNSNKLLTVDQNGDVVLTSPFSPSIAANNGLQVNTSGFVQLGGNCTNATEVFNARLQSDRRIDLFKRNLFFNQPSAAGFLAQGRVGFGDFSNCQNPGNLVEITKTSGFGNLAGLSGLRLGDLRLGATVNPANGKALSVDANGDVILVSAAAGGGNVNACGFIPVDNVVKHIGGNVICQTNITDLAPFFGTVGINQTAPNDGLDVSPPPAGQPGTGDIDVTSLTNRYEINDMPMLWHKGNIGDLFIGVNAGNAITFGAPTGSQNTVVGAEAHSTFLNMGQNSSFFGHAAGRNTGWQNNSTMIGCESGENCAPGADENTFVGWRSGRNNQGLHNVFVGNMSGMNNVGFQNTFVGIGSGINGGGAFNVSIGGGSGPINNTLANSISIGNGVNTQNSNQMLLGDNTINVGIGLNTDPTGPSNKLEIDAGLNGTLPSLAGAGASGLRFRDLKSNASTIPNPGPGVLAVDNFGDVIYVPAPTGGGSSVGNYCGTVPNPLTGPYEVPLNGNDYLFRDDATNTDRVGIGYNCSGSLPGKLSVFTAFPTNITPFSYAVHGLNNNTSILSTNTGVYGESDNPGLSTDAYGVWGKAVNSSRRNIGVFGQGGTNIASNSYGGYFEAMQGSNNLNTGVYAEADGSPVMNVGVQAVGRQAQYSFGGIFDAISMSSNLNCIGVTGRGFQFGSSAIPTYPFTSRIGVYGQTQFAVGDYAGYFDGDVYVNGPTSSVGYLVSSDRKFKKDITHLENSLDLIMKLKPCTYNYATNNNWGINFSDGKQYGFIAQEVEEVIPELVKEIHKPAMANKDHEIVKEAVDYKAVNYDGFIPVLVKAVQELQTQNENQSKLIEELNEKIAMLSNNQTPTKQETTLGDGNVILLDQNFPNPFSDKTVIAYNIPPQAQSAYIHFYTNDGKLIQKTLLTQKGRGEITVYANSLANGNYTYSLVVDGRTIDSKRMTLNH